MSIISRLRIKTEQPLYLLNVPADVKHLFPETDYKVSLPKAGKASQVLWFAKDKKSLEAKSASVLNSLNDDGLLWIAYPKKSGTIKSDLIRDDGWQVMYESAWEGVASASIDDNWSGMRFRHKNATRGLKRLPPVEERKTEGIDYINRTVTLPEDAKKAMKNFKGLEEFFNAMSFTHKKEYAESIAEAKKPETRQRRIEKMIETVSNIKLQKESKQKRS